jgi:hypothetical protein
LTVDSQRLGKRIDLTFAESLARITRVAVDLIDMQDEQRRITRLIDLLARFAPCSLARENRRSGPKGPRHA